MELIPAVDILMGRVVRLEKGEFHAVTTYGSSPVEMARTFAQQGATRLHVVDLDGARTGTSRNRDAIAKLLEATKLCVQVGGGIRTRDDAETWLSRGAGRVVLGTAAVQDPRLVRELCEAHPGKIIVALDARGSAVAVEGWQVDTTWALDQLAPEVAAWGAAAILYTPIERDGMRTGPDIERTLALQSMVSVDVIASGGIGTLEHVRALAKSGVRAAVCGRALYSGAFSYREALSVLQELGAC